MNFEAVKHETDDERYERLCQERDVLEARLSEINRPHPFLAGPETLGVFVRMQRARAEKERWAQEHPDLEREHNALAGKLDEVNETLRGIENWRAQERAAWEAVESGGAGPRLIRALRGASESEAISSARDFACDISTFLLLSGSPGVGKSVAAAEVLRLSAMRGARVLFARAVECVRMSLFAPEDIARVREMRAVGALVLDDLGVETLTDVWRQTLEDVVDARYEHQRKTVITTNLTPEAFKERYGARIADRIRQDCQVVLCGNVSLRRKRTTESEVAQ